MSKGDKVFIIFGHIIVAVMIVMCLSGFTKPLKQLPFGQFKYCAFGVLTLLCAMALIAFDIALVIIGGK